MKHQHFLPDAELLEGRLLNYPVSSDWATEVEKHLAIYAKEQTLYCCAFFVHGETLLLGKKQEVFAPLFLYEASLIWEEEIAYLNIDLQQAIVNPSIASSLKNDTTDPSSNVYDTLSNKLPKGAIGFTAIHEIEEQLQAFFPNLDMSALKDYPSLLDESAIKTIRKTKENNTSFKLLPALGVGIMKKSTASRGILTELEIMENALSFSSPIKTIFTNSGHSKAIKAPDTFMVPATLSASQEAVFHAAFKNDLSLVVGPPGTGKSFTIAALAVEFLTNGKSVLIASKNDQAVHVIAEKIDRDFGLPKVVVNAANRNYKQALQNRLKNILSGMIPDGDRMKVIELQKELDELSKSIATLEKEVQNREKTEIEEGVFILKQQQGTLELSPRARRYLQALGMADWRIAEKYFPIETIQRKLKTRASLWALMFELGEKNARRHDCTRKVVGEAFAYYLNEGLRKYRQSIQLLLKALQARTGNKKEGIFEDINFEKILEILPIWTVNAANVHTVLPLREELFDLVIIDEATQCDIASILPLLYRAKRAVIVGDPKQLRHLSFLSRQQQEQLQTQNNLTGKNTDLFNYRKKSILDLVSDIIPNQEQVQFLNEHYRSMPDIIQFSNQRFYDNQLTVMTASPASLSRQHVFLHPTDGKRYKTGYNKTEATAILEELIQIIENEQLIEKSLCKSIGVLSPFREQVNYLQRQISQQFTSEQIARHRLLVGTPFSFQGEERDLMFLSFVLDNESHASAFQYLNRPDVFNVSITRARSAQHVYTSFDPANFKFHNLPFDYINSLNQPDANKQTITSYKPDAFVEEISQLLQKFDIQQLYQAYPIAGVEIDLVAVNTQGKTRCIDLVGYPGTYEAVIPLERWRMLERVGMQVFFLSYTRWHFEREKCVAALREFVD